MTERMFHVLVLGGMSLVGCGGSTTADQDQGSGDDAAASGVGDATPADVASPLDRSVGPLDGAGSLDVNSDLDAGDTGADVRVFPREAPPPPPPIYPDAESLDAGGDVAAYADASIQGESGVPMEAPQ